MVAVACGTGKYNVAPHFRATEPHRKDCDEDGRIVVTAAGHDRQIEETGSTAVGIPKRLYFRETNPQRPQPGTSPEEVKSRKDVYVGEGYNDQSGSHRPVAYNVSGLARAYCDNPLKRNASLQIKGCDCNSYRTCFRQLWNGPLDNKFKGGILFAPIRFRDAEIGDCSTILRLNRKPIQYLPNRDYRTIEEYYRIKFVINGWSVRAKTNFRNDLKNFLGNQKRNYARGWPRTVYIFFLITEQRSTVEFLVNRHQEFVFLELDKQQIDSL